jgi:glycosyltransferase involved in cell wall biosynthesis
VDVPDRRASYPAAPRLSVVIPAYNEEHYLGATLESLQVSARRYREKTGRSAEFIVVDNASTDATAAVAKRGGARVVFEPRRQIAAARNRGASEARGDIVITCDADNQVSANLLERIDEVMSTGRAVGGGVRIVPEKRSWGIRLMFGPFEFLSRLLGVSFGVIYTHRDTFRRIGGFPTSVYAGEDALFVWALKREAWRRGQAFANLRDAYIVTSVRKIDEFGAFPQALTYLKFLLFPWTLRRRDSCRTWYRVREKR